MAGKVDVTLHISADETKVYTVQKPSNMELGFDRTGATWRQTGTYLWAAVLERAFQGGPSFDDSRVMIVNHCLFSSC